MKKSEKSTVKAVVTLLNKYRGVRITEIEVESSQEVKIHFRCRFKRSLAMICGAVTDTFSSIWCFGIPPDYTKVDHVLFMMPCEEEESDLLITNLRDGVRNNPELDKDYVLRN